MSARGPYAKGEAKRKEILRVALEVVAEMGCRSASNREIAHRAGLSQAGLAHYFGSREELYMAILRTREREQLEAADVVFDVGRIFDPAACRFDHHQPEYKEGRDNGIPYSSFGLVWRELGVELCGSEAAAARVDHWLVQGVVGRVSAAR